MVRVRQRFDPAGLADVSTAVGQQMARPEIRERVREGQTIAIGVGSRGIPEHATVVAAVVTGLRRLGAEPFIFPAMGTHGSTTAEGQQQVLASQGITSDRVGAAIRATLDTVVVARLDDGTPIHVDRYAAEADGVVLINRVKPHTSFRGRIESGILKMAAVGMGHAGSATALHGHGMDRLPTLIPDVAARLWQKLHCPFGLAIVENAYEQIARVEALVPDEMLEREAALLAEARRRMPRLLVDDIDVLVLDEVGKEISGAGADPNVVGRNARGIEGFDSPRVKFMVVLDLTDASHGNASGIGHADLITRRLAEKIDFASTYRNIMTAGVPNGAAIPMVAANARDAISAALAMLPHRPDQARVVRIRNSSAVREIQVSSAVAGDLRGRHDLEVIGEPEQLIFDADDELGQLRFES